MEGIQLRVADPPVWITFSIMCELYMCRMRSRDETSSFLSIIMEFITTKRGASDFVQKTYICLEDEIDIYILEVWEL